jgi:hypothetical protein
MRTLFAILGLLLCLIAARADELPVIKDSETIRYVGKSVEVRGFVVSVPISPLGTAFINFGQDYPNQTGFLQLAGSSFRAIKYWSGFAGGFCSGTLKCSANKPPEIFAFLLL